MHQNPSKRHHFISVHYQKLFTNKDLGYYVFDIKKGKFKQDGRLFYPNSHFYEIDDNTFKIDDYPPIRMEEYFYSPHDKLANNTIKNVIANYLTGVVTVNDIEFLNFFFGQLIWRNPNSIKFIKILLKTLSLSKLGVPIRNIETDQIIENSLFEQKLKENPNGYKFLKTLVPYPLSIANILDYQNFSISKIHGENLPGIIGDIPYVTKTSNIAKAFIESAVFPLGKDIYAIRMNNLSNYISSKVKILIDLIIFKQAQSYVAVSDIDYIDFLKSNPLFPSSIGYCIKVLFSYLENANDGQ